MISQRTRDSIVEFLGRLYSEIGENQNLQRLELQHEAGREGSQVPRTVSSLAEASATELERMKELRQLSSRLSSIGWEMIAPIQHGEELLIALDGIEESGNSYHAVLLRADLIRIDSFVAERQSLYGLEIQANHWGAREVLLGRLPTYLFGRTRWYQPDALAGPSESSKRQPFLISGQHDAWGLDLPHLPPILLPLQQRTGGHFSTIFMGYRYNGKAEQSFRLRLRKGARVVLTSTSRAPRLPRKRVPK